MSIPIKTIAVLSARLRKLERLNKRLNTSLENWKKCAALMQDTIHEYGAIMAMCRECQKKKKRLYAKKAGRATPRPGEAN